MKKNSLFESKMGRILFCLYAVAAVWFCCSPCFVSAANGDPLTVVNNLSTFVFALIRAVGMILLGWGVVQVGLSFQSHDPSQRRGARAANDSHLPVGKD